MAPTATIGLLQHTLAAMPTTCASIVVTSTQARAASTSMPEGVFVALPLVCKFYSSCSFGALATRNISILELHIIYGGAETPDIACKDGQYTLDIAFLAFCDVKKLSDFEASNSAIIDI